MLWQESTLLTKCNASLTAYKLSSAGNDFQKLGLNIFTAETKFIEIDILRVKQHYFKFVTSF